MPSCDEICGIIVGGCRIACYTLCCKIICRKKGHVPRPAYRVVCLGLGDAGKSCLLGNLIGNDINNLQPTIGFSIFAVPFEKCILNIKEIGGGEKVRPYWDRYLQETPDAILLVISAVDEEQKIHLAHNELKNACQLPSLHGLPVHIVITHTDSPGARSKQEVLDLLDAASWLSTASSWTCSSCDARDLSQCREAMTDLTYALLPQNSDQKNKRGFSSF